MTPNELRLIVKCIKNAPKHIKHGEWPHYCDNKHLIDGERTISCDGCIVKNACLGNVHLLALR